MLTLANDEGNLFCDTAGNLLGKPPHRLQNGTRPMCEPMNMATKTMMKELESKFQDYIICARAFGDEVSPETLVMLAELCNRSNIKSDELIEEMARRDGQVKVRLGSGPTILCFPDQLEPEK